MLTWVGANMTTSDNIPATSRHQNQRARRANTRSANNRRLLIWTLILTLVSILIAICAYLYINREQPLVHLKVAAGPFRSDSYELMKETADVVSRQSDLIRIDLVATSDSSKNISILNKGQVDLATIRSDTPVAANVRMIAELFQDYFQIITKPESGIFNVKDLIGKRVAIPPFGTDEFRSFWAIGDHYNLPIKAIKWVAMPFSTAVDKFLKDEVQAIFTVRSLRDRLLLNLHEDALLKGQSLKIVPIEQAKAIAIKRPFLGAAKIPKGTFAGNPIVPRRDTTTSTVSRILVTREDIDPAVIRELTSILFENRLDLVIRFALANAIKKPASDNGISIPMHAGSQQYYDRDQPSFLQQNAEPIALMITIAAMIFSGLLALRARLTSGQKNRMDSYNYMLLDIADSARISNNILDLKNMKTELYGILETVVRALDTDEVTEEGFQSFSLLWESVREVINDRQNELRLES